MTLRQAVDRYGAAVVIVVALALLVFVTPPKHSSSDALNTNSNSFTNSGDASASGALGTTDSTLPDGSVVSGADATNTGSTAPNAGTTTNAPIKGAGVTFGTGPHCRADGRQIAIERVAPPCANWTSAPNNGGATSPGVTNNQILIVRYLPQVDPATEAILQNAKLADPPATVTNAYKAMFTYFNQHYETYGRQVVFQDFNATGPSDNEEQARADAVTIATKIKPFAVWDGTDPKAFAVEIASRHIICICTVTLSSQFYQSLPPYIFGALPTSTEYSQHLGEYIGKKLWNRPAKFVGQGFLPNQTSKRKFGLIYINGNKGVVDPEGERAKDSLVSEMGKYGAKFGDGDIFSYTYDPGRNQSDFANMMIKFHSDGVTTLVMFVDPLSPILITSAATNQGYYPEWLITGSGLSDTTAAGRLYDQTQWVHAFGISPLWVTWATVANSYGYREAHHGDPSMKPGDEGVLINIYAAVPRILFTGIQMAGPNLTPDNFANGEFAFPHSGGTPATPLQYFTRQYPTAIKDFMEIYYDGSKSGPDERGINGKGMIMKMHGGKRYTQGQWDTAETQAFNDPTAVSVSDDPSMGGDPPHEQDGHHHTGKCLSCTG
ncbi:MAG TPA: hypothetical protein VHC63_10965 [Acidimicrobiales bacterium]|nr:hypothetical protein [Acidimicrobiales bacterium]